MEQLDKILKEEYGISDEVLALGKEAETALAEKFQQIDVIAQYNQTKVLRAFREHNVSEAHLGMSTGYGYDDIGRDTLEKIYATVFGVEAALVRTSLVSGTHALCVCLFGLLRPGDTLLSVTGAPYDTLEEIIGIHGDSKSSLKDWGIAYRELALTPQGYIDLDGLATALQDPTVRVCELQRSKGYRQRPSYTIEELAPAIALIHQLRPDVAVMVDNCYGEFTQLTEPTQIGADVMVGSLIKNPGGGLALSGGYIVGRSDLIEKISYRMTSPGIGAEVGASLGMNRLMYQGFFMSPHTVAQSMKTAVFTAEIFSRLGFVTIPDANAQRGDIIQSVALNTAENLCAFCRGIQRGAPIDSFVTPEPWDMPGYQDPVVMAAGAFVSGASIEISADGPLRPPYAAYMQGGLTYESGKLAVMCAAEDVLTAMKNNK